TLSAGIEAINQIHIDCVSFTELLGKCSQLSAELSTFVAYLFLNFRIFSIGNYAGDLYRLSYCGSNSEQTGNNEGEGIAFYHGAIFHGTFLIVLWWLSDGVAVATAFF